MGTDVVAWGGLLLGVLNHMGGFATFLGRKRRVAVTISPSWAVSGSGVEGLQCVIEAVNHRSVPVRTRGVGALVYAGGKPQLLSMAIPRADCADVVAEDMWKQLIAIEDLQHFIGDHPFRVWVKLGSGKLFRSKKTTCKDLGEGMLEMLGRRTPPPAEHSGSAVEETTPVSR